MSKFVDQCRREWRRLGVPEDVAEEMAADLEADLAEAASEGSSAADVLGAGALDARSFAASWASERGVVPRPVGAEDRRRRLALAAFATVATVVMIGASLAILAWDPGVPAQLGLPEPRPEARTHVTVPASVFVGAPDAGTDELDPVGWLLLGVGLVGLVPAFLLWWPRVVSRGRHAPA
jgi:hypothetical protein